MIGGLLVNAPVPSGALDAVRSPWVHERLHAYRAALEFYKLATAIRRGLTRAALLAQAREKLRLATLLTKGLMR